MSKNILSLEGSLLRTVSYFEFFQYPPTISELARFSCERCSMRDIRAGIESLQKCKKLIISGDRVAKDVQTHTLFNQHEKFSTSQILRFNKLSRAFTWIPSIRYVGISGSLSMNDADSEADIDLFTITSSGTVWITRFLLLAITRSITRMGNQTARKLCWNIHIEESDLRLPREKRNEYTAHEILQLQTVFERHHIYAQFLQANSWISKIFPNVQVNYTGKINNYRMSIQYKALLAVDSIFRFLQLFWLKKKGYVTHEYGRQVWFIQDDFEKKIPLKLKKV